VHKRLGQTTDRISPATFRRQQVSTVGRREPATITASSSLGGAIEAMQAGDTRSVLVTDADQRLVGVFTERDIVLRVVGADPAADPSHTIGDYMTANPDALTLDSTLGEALQLMAERGYHGVPLVDDAGRVAGHLDSRDVLEYIAEAFPQEVLNLPPRPHQRMDQPEGA
jgi:CBS domain-containing protein